MQKTTKYIAHCLNSSPSKKTHAFGRAERFSPCKSYGQFKYNIHEKSTKISATFGYGDKQDHQKIFEKHSPSPNRYLIKSQFDNINKGYSFGKSPSKLRTRDNQKKEHHQSVNVWMNDKQNLTEENYNPEDIIEKLKNKLMGGNKAMVTSNTANQRNTEQRKTENRKVTPTKPPSPGPGTYNRFSEFGPVNYYR